MGIGASAGGLNAFKSFLAHLPSDTGMAFVLVQHLDPSHKSILVDLLAPQTAMPVQYAEDGVPVRANAVFVIPPDGTLLIKGGRLRLLRPAPPRQHRWPIDDFFSSLALDQGEKAVCIVLSGLGSDGTRGLRMVKERGGFTMAQAGFDHIPLAGMPHSAAATGLVDQVLPVEDMPARLVEHKRYLSSVAGQKVRDGTRHDVAQHLSAIAFLLRAAVGHDFSQYKPGTMIRRVQRRMQVLQLDEVPAYVELLRRDPSELNRLFRELLVSVTQFFRDPEAFEALRVTVITRLLSEARYREPFRVWVPACATGEEVYSIAMLLREEADRLGVDPSIQIFGTDIDEAAIATARAGRYVRPMPGVSRERASRWFTEDGGEYTVNRRLREMCLFSTHNIIRDAPFSKLHLISCRNLLIYLGPDLQRRAMQIFHYALTPDGALFLGPSEGVGGSRLFRSLDKKHRLFEPRGDVQTPMVLPDLSVPAPSAILGVLPPLAAQANNGERFDRRARRLLERHSPAFVVIDVQHDILRFSGEDLARYLELPAGAATLNLFAVLRGSLRPIIRAAIARCLEERQPVEQEHIAVRFDGQIHEVTAIVARIDETEAEGAHFLVAFKDLGPIVKTTRRKSSNTALQSLEQELRAAKMQIQAAIDERQSAAEEARSINEEYQSINEEVQSANEELETSKEELQSINEELQTVNNELSGKNELLSRLNSDLRNLLDSTQIATVFLDRDLRITNFTPAMTEVFPLQDVDRGRPLTDIVSRLTYATLRQDVEKVLRDLSIVEREVTLAEHNRTFIMRIRPYRRVDQFIDGVVITFVDNTANRLGESQRMLLVSELSHRVKNSLATVLAIAKQTIKGATSIEAFAEVFEARLLSLANTHDILMANRWQGAALHDLVAAELTPFLDNGAARWSADGPAIKLDPKTALALTMTLHELATNAAKHGAFGTQGGRVEVTWKNRHLGESRRLHLLWRETGGPEVREPTRKGFGTWLITEGLAYELNGEVQLDFAPGGLRCSIDVPLTAGPTARGDGL